MEESQFVLTCRPYPFVLTCRLYFRELPPVDSPRSRDDRKKSNNTKKTPKAQEPQKNREAQVPQDRHIDLGSHLGACVRATGRRVVRVWGPCLGYPKSPWRRRQPDVTAGK